MSFTAHLLTTYTASQHHHLLDNSSCSSLSSMTSQSSNSTTVVAPSNIFPSNSIQFSHATNDDTNKDNKAISIRRNLINCSKTKTASPTSITTATTTNKVIDQSACVVPMPTTPKVEKLFHCSVVPPQHQRDNGKLTVVLDIDETLIHARLPDDNYRQEEERLDVLQSEYKGDTFEVTLRQGETFMVNKRPGLDEFLEQASKHFELIAYTAAIEEYAKPLLDKIDPDNKYFRHRLYRSHCVFANGHFVKDLRVVNRRLDRVVLVDNNAYCFLPQLGNGIPISSFYNDHSDTALNVLLKFLLALHQENEVQPMLREVFNLEKILTRDREVLLAGIPHFCS